MWSPRARTKEPNGSPRKTRRETPKEKGSQEMEKGKEKSFDQKGPKGNVNAQNDRSKGKGKGDSKAYFVCGRPGHLAKDCCRSTQVRLRQVGFETAQTTTTTAQGSPSSSLSAMPSVSQQQPVTPSPATQYKVARICEIE